MREGIVFITGQFVDIQSANFTSKKGDEVKKTVLLLKPAHDGAEAIELEVWGEQAEAIEAQGPVGMHVFCRCGLVGRSWTNQQGETNRRVAVRLRDFENLEQGATAGTTTQTPNATEDVPF